MSAREFDMIPVDAAIDDVDVDANPGVIVAVSTVEQRRVSALRWRLAVRAGGAAFWLFGPRERCCRLTIVTAVLIDGSAARRPSICRDASAPARVPLGTPTPAAARPPEDVGRAVGGGQQRLDLRPKLAVRPARLRRESRTLVGR